MSPKTQRNPYEIHWHLRELGSRATAQTSASGTVGVTRQATPSASPRASALPSPNLLRGSVA